MRIVVIGSTGGTGRLVLQDAVARGHQVTAFARRSTDLSQQDGLAGVVQGDARDADTAAQAIAGQDAVVVTVSGRGQSDVIRDVAVAVIAAMTSVGVRRIVFVSAYGPVSTKPVIIASIVRRVFAAQFADQVAADRIVAASDADWTIARATRLTNAAPKSAPRVSLELFTTGPFAVSRRAWAGLLVDLAESGAYQRQTINVTG